MACLAQLRTFIYTNVTYTIYFILFLIEPPTAIPEVIISNGTIDCVCVCKHTNQTVDEIMQQRKIQLTVDTEALSSTLI